MVGHVILSIVFAAFASLKYGFIENTSKGHRIGKEERIRLRVIQIYMAVNMAEELGDQLKICS